MRLCITTWSPSAPVLRTRAEELPQTATGTKPSFSKIDMVPDAPDGEFYADLFERLAPRQHALVDTVDKRAIEIEQERRA